MSPTPVTATRVTTAELAWLLGLRAGASATLVAVALGLPEPASGPPDEQTLEAMLAVGRAQDRRGELLPHGEVAVIGDVLTSADALISIGTPEALAALVAIGRDRTLVLAPTGAHDVEVAALDAATAPGAAAEALAIELGDAARVIVAVPGAAITEVTSGPGLRARIEELLP